MYTYSMMPLDIDHIDELTQDIKDQYARGISSCPMFIMTLVPEGNPVWDKVGDMCDKFARFRDRLEPLGVTVGILIQASIGHGYTLVPSPFEKYVGVADGKEYHVHCPLGRGFLEHFKGVLRRIASERPAAIMLDDDFRLVMRGGRGCACPLHLARLEKKIGKKLTRDELWAHIDSHPDDDPVTRAFLETQAESLAEAAKEFRSAIDEINPKIQGINCTSGDLCDFVIHTAPIFAGKGNPIMVRVPNGTYAPETTKGFSDIMRRAAVCSAKLKSHGVDVVLAETDTIPFNRYGKNARYLHSQYSASILEGLMGAKHWITRTASFEPKSGVAFRNILAEHKNFYDRLFELSHGIRWLGASSGFIEQEHMTYKRNNMWSYHDNFWATKVLERLGLPFYFSDKAERVTFLEGRIARDMTNEQIENFFEGSVFMTSSVADDLVRRGYGDLLGVSVREWTGEFVSGEVYSEPSLTSTKQKNAMEIVIENERVETLSYSYKKKSGEKVKLFPAVTVLEREGGKLSVVYCGEPNAPHTYGEGFSFLNETRKAQFVSLLKRAAALPIYYDGDVEICMRAGEIKDGRMLAAFYNLGFDPLDSLPLYLEKAPERITSLDRHGEEREVAFTALGDGKYELDLRVEPMYPVILLIK